MKIDVISIRSIEGAGNLKAFVDIRMDKAIVIRGCSVMENDKRLFVSLPRKVSASGTWSDVVIITDESIKAHCLETILTEYKNQSNRRPHEIQR